VVDADPLGVDAEGGEAVALGGEVLSDSRHPGVVDLQPLVVCPRNGGAGGRCLDSVYRVAVNGRA